MAISGEAGNRRFVSTLLPRVVGVGGFLIFLFTINPWVSIASLGTVNWISGWAWHPVASQPLTVLLFLPFRVLPSAWVPLALNFFTVACAALVLALLARSVALLPHNITPEHLLRKGQPAAVLSVPGAWMPPVLAAILCGLQSSFWEHATSASGEMIDLLLFACVIVCLLEFRVSREPVWLFRCVFLYGAGMANDWTMIALFPVFIAALFRTAGARFFLKGNLLLRMALWGLAGLGFYLLLPILHAVLPSDKTTFWTALKENLKSQLALLLQLQKPSFRALAIASLAPLLILCVRWKSHTAQRGDDSRFAVFLTRASGHVAHGLLLLTSLWMALDPAFSPRYSVPGSPMLKYFYVSALIFGYCCGYFLLLGHGKPRSPLARRAAAAIFMLLCALPLALGWRNLGQLRAMNGPGLHEFARQLYADLPEGKSVALSDDPLQLALLQAEAGAHRRGKEILPLDTLSLFSPRYQIFLSDRFKSRWPVAPSPDRVQAATGSELLKLVSGFAAHEPVVYLHPSSGLYLEQFLAEPQGSVYQLVHRPLRDLREPRLSEAVVLRNEELWQQRWTHNLQRLAREIKSQVRDLSTEDAPSLIDRLRFAPARNATALWLGRIYSKTLNCWGVEMQRLDKWTQAGVWFERALALNPHNRAAQINLAWNQQCRQGNRARLDPALQPQLRDLAVERGKWPEIINAGGTVDEPTFLLRTARMMLASASIRQAAADFTRCTELAPDWPQPKLQLAQCCNQLGDFDGALALTETFSDTNRLNDVALAALLYCRATALEKLGRSADATACIEKFSSDYRKHIEVLVAAADLYEHHEKFKEELAMVDQLLQLEPDRPGFLSRKGLAQLRLGRFREAIETLTRALSLAPSNNGARLVRAIAFMGADKLDEARNDYEALLKSSDNSLDATFGLGTIAWRRQETNKAIGFYRQYLSNAAPDSVQYVLASDRLKQLNGNSSR